MSGSRSLRARLGLLAAAAAVLPLAGCGGDAKPPPGSPDNPLVARTTDAPGQRADEAAAPAGYQALVKRQSSAPEGRFTPCNLVTRSEAGAILGGPIALPTEAPQGPTCIYRSDNPRATFVTVAVQRMTLNRLRRVVRDRRDVRIGSRTALCGTHGQPVFYLGMSRGRVLSISAPCDVARRFAAKAAPRLGAAGG